MKVITIDLAIPKKKYELLTTPPWKMKFTFENICFEVYGSFSDPNKWWITRYKQDRREIFCSNEHWSLLENIEYSDLYLYTFEELLFHWPPVLEYLLEQKVLIPFVETEKIETKDSDLESGNSNSQTSGEQLTEEVTESAAFEKAVQRCPLFFQQIKEFSIKIGEFLYTFHRDGEGDYFYLHRSYNDLRGYLPPPSPLYLTQTYHWYTRECMQAPSSQEDYLWFTLDSIFDLFCRRKGPRCI
jgi:hypothetical protein